MDTLATRKPTPARKPSTRTAEHTFWKWVFRVAMLSGIVTMLLTLVLVLR